MVIDMVEVFEARMASSRMCCSVSASTACLTFGVFHHRFHHDVDAIKAFIAEGRVDVVEHFPIFPASCGRATRLDSSLLASPRPRSRPDWAISFILMGTPLRDDW